MSKKIDDNLWNLTKEVDYVFSSIINRNPLTQNGLKSVPFIEDYKAYMAIMYDVNNSSVFVDNILELTDKCKPLIMPLITKAFNEFYDKKLYLFNLWSKIANIGNCYEKVQFLAKNVNSKYLDEDYIHYNKLNFKIKSSIKVNQFNLNITYKTDTLYDTYIRLLDTCSIFK